MGRKNPLEGVFDRVTDDFTARMRKAKQSPAVPLGQEELRPRDARARFAKMTPFERRQLRQQKGQTEILRILRMLRKRDV